MKTYRTDQHQIKKPSKLIEHPNGFEVTSNDGTIKIELRHTTVMDGAIDSSFYHTVMWIMEGDGWTRVSDTQSYKSKDEFIRAISEVEEFTQALSEYKFNNNNEL